MKRLFFVRHGETEMNAAGIWSGQSETSLTRRGVRQARRAGRKLKKVPPKIDLIVCSPQSRALHTAQIIAEEIGYLSEGIVQNDLFVERSFGVLEGTSSAGYYSQYTFRDLEDIHQAETVPEVQARAEKALAFLNTLPAENILVVSHAAFGRALRRVVEKLPHTHEYDFAHRMSYRIANAEVVELI